MRHAETSSWTRGQEGTEEIQDETDQETRDRTKNRWEQTSRSEKSGDINQRNEQKHFCVSGEKKVPEAQRGEDRDVWRTSGWRPAGGVMLDEEECYINPPPPLLRVLTLQQPLT